MQHLRVIVFNSLRISESPFVTRIVLSIEYKNQEIKSPD